MTPDASWGHRGRDGRDHIGQRGDCPKCITHMARGGEPDEVHRGRQQDCGACVASVQHELKIEPEPFRAVHALVKTYEVRRHDRDVRVGDTLLLREYDPDRAAYTGASVRADVVHVTRPGQWGLSEGVAVYGIRVFGRALEPRVLAASFGESAGVTSSAP